MTVRPESGPEYGQERWERPAPPPTELEAEERELYEGERELSEREQEDRELDYLDPENNELHVAGQLCQRCGTAITVTQEARLLPDGHWIHEACPVHP
jgi:hypothetical protein